MSKSKRFGQARYAEATEAIEALIQMPYRVSRRRSNHPYETSLLATDLTRIRRQLELSSAWISEDHRRLGNAFRVTLDTVDRFLGPRLAAAWTHPDTSGGAWTVPTDMERTVLRAWRRCSRLRFLPGRLLLGPVVARLERVATHAF